MNTSFPLRSFRLVCKPEYIPLVEKMLEQQGFRFVPDLDSPWVRRLLEEPFPLGSSFAARFGSIYIQDKSSMLPPLMLAPHVGASVLDMCASPGSKTGFLGQLVGASGFVLGNEPSHSRLATLRRNLTHLNLLQCATTSYGGEQLPKPVAGVGWEYIQLDPPCSGWGTVEKNPQVLALWQGDKVKPLVQLQRQLLQHAFELLAPGGKLVYSTCTTNIAENEEQLAYACDELGYVFMPLDPPSGVQVEESLIPRFAGCLRIATSQDAQGFFVAMLQKPLDAVADFGIAGGGEPVTPLEAAVFDPAPVEADSGRSMRHSRKKSYRLGGRQAPSRTCATAWTHAECIDPQSLDGALSCSNILPEGDVAVFNGVVHFLPKAARILLPPHMIWKGFPLGKMGADGTVRVSASLRCFMPSLEDAHKQGLPVLEVEDAKVLQGLLAGQSIPVEKKANAIGLYYLGMPLCMLTIKGKRAVLVGW